MGRCGAGRYGLPFVSESRHERRVIASLADGPHKGLLRIARRTIEPYAHRHGYELALRTDRLDPSRPAPWSKILLLRELAQRYDTIVWLDADLVIVDQSVDIATELRPRKLLHLVEHTVGEARFPNTGVMLLRGGSETVRFLDEVWAHDELVNHRWWENAAVCTVLGYSLEPPRPQTQTEWLARTQFISPRWNWIPDARVPRARIRHFPGFATRTRRVLMSAATLEARARSLGRRSAS